MHFHGFVEILLIGAGLTMVQCLEKCSWYETAVNEDKYMKRHVVHRVNLPSVYSCATECVVSSVCKSFNFQPETNMCELNSNSSDSVGTTSKLGYVFSNINDWPELVAGTCSTKSCRTGEKCKVNRLGTAVCIKEFVGCSTPPRILDSMVSYEGHYENAEAIYTCNNNFRTCDKTDWRLRCKPSGTWDGVSPTCRRYRWTEQVTPFNQSIQCGSASMVNITWIGTPQATTNFDTYLDAGPIIPFYMTPRGYYIVLNTRRNGIWEKEIPIFTFHFVPGNVFSMDVMLQNGQYTVHVNGTLLITFKERLEGIKPKRFIITGAVSVHSVEINS